MPTSNHTVCLLLNHSNWLMSSIWETDWPCVTAKCMRQHASHDHLVRAGEGAPGRGLLLAKEKLRYCRRTVATYFPTLLGQCVRYRQMSVCHSHSLPHRIARQRRSYTLLEFANKGGKGTVHSQVIRVPGTCEAAVVPWQEVTNRQWHSAVPLTHVYQTLPGIHFGSGGCSGCRL